MPIEKNNVINAHDADPETLLENDKSKDLHLTDDRRLPNKSLEDKEHEGYVEQ